MSPLPLRFYDRHVVTVARELLGQRLVRKCRAGRMSGRIVEVEAYLAEGDDACHAYRRKTRRNAAMFGPPGRAYVYAIHTHWCLNVVTDRVASAVLIRAIEPIDGGELMARNRGRPRPLEWTRGPGRLCQALAIDRGLNEWNLSRGSRLWIERQDTIADADVAAGPRIGLTRAADLPLRFYRRESPFVSLPRRETAPVDEVVEHFSTAR